MSETSSDTTPQETANEKLESGKAHVKQAAQDLRAAAETKAHDLRAKAEDKSKELRIKAEQAYEQARAKARSLQKDGEHYVRENPMRGILTALGVGFVIGLLFRR